MPLDALNVLQGPTGAKQEVYSGVPREIITGTGAVPKPRVRVDQGSTGFFEGRQFRATHEFNIPNGQSVWGRLITVTDVIVVHRHITVVQGNMRFAMGIGGTPGGTWTDKPLYPVNAMSERPTPLYIVQTLASFGGTQTGLTELDIALLETGTSQAVSAQNIAEEVGLAAGTYYVEIRNTGATTLRGLYSVIFEERQPASSAIT